MRIWKKWESELGIESYRIERNVRKLLGRIWSAENLDTTEKERERERVRESVRKRERERERERERGVGSL